MLILIETSSLARKTVCTSVSTPGRQRNPLAEETQKSAPLVKSSSRVQITCLHLAQKESPQNSNPRHKNTCWIVTSYKTKAQKIRPLHTLLARYTTGPGDRFSLCVCCFAP